MTIQNPLCVALDTPDLEHACHLARGLLPHVGLVKLGMEFFYAHGRAGYEAVAAESPAVFLDLKLHDIPNTVANGLNSLMTLTPRPAITNIHAGAGPATLKAAADALDALDGPRPKLIGLTILTSLDDGDLARVGYDAARDTAAHVLNQARMVQDCGLDGVVCSPHDVARIKAACGREFLTVVPGIRPADSATQDQKRIATPEAALAAGADVLVIGRPITQAADPAVAARTILKTLEAA